MTRLNGIISAMILMTICTPVQSQMIDMMGNIGVSGAMMQNDARAIGSMNKALQSHRLTSDISMKAAEIRTTFMDGYKRLPPQTIQSGSVKVKFAPTPNGQGFTAQMNSVNSMTCKKLMSARTDGVVSVELNQKRVQPGRGAEHCRPTNTVKLFFE